MSGWKARHITLKACATPRGVKCKMSNYPLRRVGIEFEVQQDIFVSLEILPSSSLCRSTCVMCILYFAAVRMFRLFHADCNLRF